MIMTGTIDAEARESSPNINLATQTKIGIRGSGSSLVRRGYFYPGKAPFPSGATILSATLTVYLAGAVTGSHTITAKRVETKWGETTLTYNNQPTVVATNDATATLSGGAAGDAVTFDVTAMLADVSAGAAYFGFQLTLGDDSAVSVWSAEAGNATLRPTLEVEWSDAPLAPDNLAPDAGQAVDGQFPILGWPNGFHDKAGNTTQASAQIQLMKGSNDFTTPTYDTGKIALSDSQWNSNDGVFTGIGVAETWYWRVMLWDGTDLASPWSDPAEFTRTDLGTLTINSPGSTAPETTPPIEWTLTTTTQERYYAALYRVETSGATTRLWQTSDTNGATTAVTPPSGLIKTGQTYRAHVEVWDTVDRAFNAHLTAEQDFTYVRDGTPNPVTGVTAAVYVDADGQATPAVQVDFSRSVAPDYFCLVVNGVEVADRVSVSDAHVSGSAYRITYWGLTPRQAATIGVQAVVLDTGVLKHSNTASAPGAVTPNPVGIWLVEAADLAQGATPGISVCLYGTDPAQLTIGETATTFDLVGAQAPVRVTDVIRGHEGTVSGVLLSAAARDDFNALKGARSTLQLILGDLSIPIRMEEGSAIPTPTPGDLDYTCSFNCFQVGEPWPVVSPS